MEQMGVQRRRLMTLVTVGMMAALVFAGNYMQIKIPVALGDVTRVHLGNSMCLLAGMLFGPMTGGLASGIGAGLFDLLDPVYIVSAPYTFFSKFVMGFLAGLIARRAFQREKKGRTALLLCAAVTGQLAYIVLYLFKSFVTLLLLGNGAEAAAVAIVPKIATSGINALAAIVIALPLSAALHRAQVRTGFSVLMKAPEPKGWLNPVTGGLILFCAAAALVFFLYLSAGNSLREAEDEKFAAMQEQIDQLTEKVGSLSEQLGIPVPVGEETQNAVENSGN